MKRIRFIREVAICYLSVIILLSSCRKNDTPVYDHFISDELKSLYTASTISSYLDFAATQYPGLAALKPYLAYDINVYKLAYTTKINEKDITASGLVCVPATPGEYPVLSFQNGTNTLNSNCPSEAPNDFSYQFVEFISSMGFIVVIPDYPGFGESSDIPHPYLIAEPTTTSITDMFRAVKEAGSLKLNGATPKNEYYLIGYSQGGWATLTLHKALETLYNGEFNLAGSVCGAGPYNITNLFLGIVNTTSYPMPSYLGYIINAWAAYNQFTNPITDLLNDPYAGRLASLYNGTLSLDQINKQLTTSIPELFKPGFISGFQASPSFSSVRTACVNNSVSPWHTYKPLLMLHGTGDTHVSVTSTELMYSAMLDAGTSSQTITKLLFPGLNHGDAVVPAMITGIQFLINLRDN